MQAWAFLLLLIIFMKNKVWVEQKKANIYLWKEKRKHHILGAGTVMASVSISSPFHITCSINNKKSKQQHSREKNRHLPRAGPATSGHVFTQNTEGQKGHIHGAETPMDRSKHVEVKLPEDSRDEGPTTPKFEDERWKKGTWDLNMFVENGRVDWDGIIVAAKRLWEAKQGGEGFSSCSRKQQQTKNQFSSEAR
ncbi:hypothetical protein CDL15_Pgr022830 [Punica granatum]|uniref:Uncharacterized protein n=1 Tax=Punica granatum TaxID=22663 RepID=A0A218X3R6_PUNGR|nr:hypothetical protein CDL15_Pgr022830 [Punica granatum]